MSALVLGPLLRYVDDTSATVWVETAEAATVRVVAGVHRAQASTFAAHGHHYALVELVDLTPGSRLPYVVEIDEVPVWPPTDSTYPPPVIATLELGRPLRLAFGSCRVSVPHDKDGNEAFGIDALRSFALCLAGVIASDGPDQRWPDLLLFLGDQAYADETSDAMQEFIESRRSLDEPPGRELKDYEEYAHLYRLAWSEPANRWLLSSLPSAMIFDDHDIRDDWNSSWSWKQKMEATSWWHGRIVGGLASYWVYQHLGNLGPVDRADDALWQQIKGYDGEGELDISRELDQLADRADQHPDSYRWSYARDFGTQARLIVVDSRAARVLDPERRSILDDEELAWLDDRMRGDVEHLLIGTSLPFLLAPGLHHAEAFSEALAEGAWGRMGARLGERMRQGADMEHWAAFQKGFLSMAELTLEVARGKRGAAPRAITFLSGDVHHSYVAEANPSAGAAQQTISRILQAVCSPIRNPLPRYMQRFTAAAARPVIARPARGLARSAGVAPSPLTWEITSGPWFDNNLAVLELPPAGMTFSWWAGDAVVEQEPTRLKRVATVDVNWGR